MNRATNVEDVAFCDVATMLEDPSTPPYANVEVAGPVEARLWRGPDRLTPLVHDPEKYCAIDIADDPAPVVPTNPATATPAVPLPFPPPEYRVPNIELEEAQFVPL